MLDTKVACEKCNVQLGHQDAAYICSFECTFCADCAAIMDYICPNCGGELLLRPIRKSVK